MKPISPNVAAYVLTGVLGSACFLGGGSPIGPPPVPSVDGGDPQPFVADSPYTYVAKVKNLLVGLPPTDAEVASVVNAADPKAQLQTLIESWMTIKDPGSPTGETYYAEKMLVFFKLATQQTQVSLSDFTSESPRMLQMVPSQRAVPGTAPAQNRFLQNATESFARTMVDQLVTNGQPTTNAATTRTFMLTTALMEVYAYLDTVSTNDSGSIVDAFATAHPTQTFTVTSAAIPISESANPASPNFMHWTDPDVAAGGAYQKAMIAAGTPACATDPVIYGANGWALHYLLWGAIYDRKSNDGTTTCTLVDGSGVGTQIGGSMPATNNLGSHDFDDWREVTITEVAQGQPTTTFYDLATLRKSSSLALHLPRVGFFTTPAFFANWQTNASNEMRVTTNQMLIVALGAMVDGTDPTQSVLGANSLPPGLDTAHAAPNTPCYGCHQLLDPTRSILASTYSWQYGKQDVASYATQKGEFSFQGVTGVYPTGVADLGTTLATHPLFASAWVEKLCFYANSQACDKTDPELLRIVHAFQSGKYAWNALVVDLLSSPLTTHAEPTQTASAPGGVVIAVSRRDHLCAALNFRLGFTGTDLCDLLPTTATANAEEQTIGEIATGLPSDGYGRGAIAPVLPNAPTLFYRSGTENICEAVAELVVDTKTPVSQKTWSSTNPTAAIADFAGTLMGLVPSDPRYAQAIALLEAEYAASLAAIDPATKATFTPTQALQSTFVSACLAPSSVSIGM